MASVTLSGGERLQKVLAEISSRASKEHKLSVGFMADAKYPDGTPVAMVAAIHNFGAPAAGIPARPFFTRMVDTSKGEWGRKIGHLLRNQGFDSRRALAAMGEDIGGDLRESIINGNWQGLSEITLMLRTMRSGDQALRVTGKTVGQAAALIAAGKKHNRSKSGSAPLIDTGHMLNSVAYQVGDEENHKVAE